MTVIRLSLSGLTDDEADLAVLGLFDHPRLERVLVDDDVGLLAKHGPAYQRLITSYRVHALLCVVVGPRAQSDGKLWLPEFLGGVQGYGVLWVGDPAGIDWRPAAVPVANGHVGASDGLDQLVDLLQADEIFDRVHQAFDSNVHGKVASPGLRLAGADDEAATFTAALAVAVGRLCGAGSGPDGPFPALLPAAAGGASLDDNGPAARYRDEIMAAAAGASKALEGVTGLRGRLRRGDGGLGGQLVELRAALDDLRQLVTRLLREAHAVGQPTDNQRRLLLSAGIRFQAGVPAAAPAPAAAADRSAISRTISAAIRGGDTLAFVTRRLARTEREVGRRGSGSYLPEVDKICPPGLLDRIVDQSPKSSLRGLGVAEARKVLGLDDAKRAGQSLVDLLIHVANREWSPTAADSGDLARTRIALDGIGAALTEQAEQPVDGASKARGARLARLGETLLPVLRDLVLRCVADEAAAPSAGGQEAFQAAHDRTVTLLSEWLRQVRAHGVTATPPFATSGRYEVQPGIEDDVAEIREALLYPPSEEMWQLCASGDIRVLEWRTSPQVVRFASRLNKEALAGTLATGEIEWTTSGSFAGLLRLIPLQSRFVDSGDGENATPPAPGTP